jgi:hypothetical protein
MAKILIFLLLFVIVIPILIQASIYFWQEVKRRRTREDRLAITEERKQALLDFKESNETFDDFMRDNYSHDPIPAHRIGGKVK